jgi:ABC-2 type transport system permease protein
MKKYFRIWLKTGMMATETSASSLVAVTLFVIGKLLRFAFLIFFLALLSSKTKLIAGYSLWQMIFFFLTFNLIDTITQFFMREVYRFGWIIKSGSFDYLLSKPFSPLFRSLFGGGDILDLPSLFIVIISLFYSLTRIGEITTFGVILYFCLILNALLIAIAFHIIVLAQGILTVNANNAIMFYRDLTQMARVPIDVYKEPLKSLITFVIPIGIMMTFPAKALMGLLSIEGVIICLLIGAFFLLISLWFWKFALKRYSSASS